MSFFDNILGKAGWVRKEKAELPSVYSGGGTDPFSIWRTSKKIDPAKALEVFTGWVYASIRAIAMDIGIMEYRLFRIGKDQDEEIFENELLDLLYGVNDYQTGFEFKYVTAAHLESTGNAYWFLEGVKSDGDKPLAIHIMNPAKVKVVVDRNVFPSRIEGYQYRAGTKTYLFKPYEVLHIKYPDPNDPYEGIGTVQSAAQWIDADNYAMEFNRGLFKNGARLGAILESDAALTADQLIYLKSSFEAAHAGASNAYKTVALPKGVKVSKDGSTQKELDFVASSDMMRNRIIAAFRVPRTALGITDDVNRANAEATDYVFAARTIKPIMMLITTYLNEFLVPRYGDDLYLDFKDPVPKDRIQETDERTKSLGGAPWQSVNEAREEAGLDPVSNGDSVLVPFNFTKLPTSDVDNLAPAKRVSRVNGGRKIKSRGARNMQVRKDITATIAQNAASAISEAFKIAAVIKKKSIADLPALTDDEYEKLYKVFAIRVTPYEKRQRQAVVEFNGKQRKEVIGNLPKITKSFLQSEVKAISKDDLFNRDAGISALVDLSTPILYDLAGKEAAEAAALIGVEDLDILTPEVRHALDRAIELLSRSYNDTTRDMLKEKLEQGLKDGLSQDELADTINGIYDYSDEVRAAQVAETETFRIANYATQEAWKQSGVVKSQRWYTAVDERVCPWCAPMQGKVISIDEDFFKKGDTVTGEDGGTMEVSYSDVGAPPLHVSCRCYIRPEEITLE